LTVPDLLHKVTDAPAAAAPSDQAELEHAQQVLYEVYGIERFADTRYLRWFYWENPLGRAMIVNRVEDGQCIGHIANIPQVYHRPGESKQFFFPLNVAVSAKARGRGMMNAISEQIFNWTAELHPEAGFVGMPNAASTPGYIKKRFYFRIVRQLPVHVVIPLPLGVRNVQSHSVDREFLESATFADLASQLDYSPGPAWSQQWSPELLRWRLAAPGARYALHVGERLAIVTAVDQRRSLPFTVVLKILPRKPRSKEPPLANGVISAACLFNRTPLAVYAGFTSAARVVGVPVPRRFLPAPLNLVVRTVRPGAFDYMTFEIDTMEFFHFDAY
jgi:hypothetical protein